MLTVYIACGIESAELITTRHVDQRKVTHLVLTDARWRPADIVLTAPGLHICGVHDPGNFPSETLHNTPASFSLFPGDTPRERLVIALSTGSLELYVDGWVVAAATETGDDGREFSLISFRLAPQAPDRHWLLAIPTIPFGLLDDLPDAYKAPSGKARIGRRQLQPVFRAVPASTSAVDVRDRIAG